MNRKLLILAGLAFGSAPVIAQTGNFIHNGGVGQVEAPNPASGCPTQPRAKLSFHCWVGQKIFFLPASNDLQHYGYQSFEMLGDEMHKSIPYQTLVGKTATVQRISEDSIGSPILIARVDGGSLVVQAGIIDESIDGIVLLRDLINAKRDLLGKTLWTHSEGINTINASGDKFGYVKLGRFSKVTVIDVVAGTYNDTPIRLILKALDGRVGYEDVAYSENNTAVSLLEFDKFENLFFTINPRSIYKFSDTIWNALQRSQILIGMNAQMVVLGWGRNPNSINRTTTGNVVHEQWVYDGGKDSPARYVYFDNGRVTSVQD